MFFRPICKHPVAPGGWDGWTGHIPPTSASCNLASLTLKLFWEKKLSGLSAFDIAEELVRTMDLPKGLQGELGRGLPRCV